jgi:hypothetical protein
MEFYRRGVLWLGSVAVGLYRSDFINRLAGLETYRDRMVGLGIGDFRVRVGFRLVFPVSRGWGGKFEWHFAVTNSSLR